jgi:putative alpha-1,2-mannosidase
VGRSAVSAEGALQNLNAEIAAFDFKKTENEAKAAWNKELSKIAVESTDKNKLCIFYTALYHCFSSPNLFMDIDGQYVGTDKKIHQAEGFDNYTVFSLWDTYRTEHPLLSIIDRKRTTDFIKTFL